MKRNAKLFTRLFASGLFSVGLLLGSATAVGGPNGTEMCNDLSRDARGLCRAAIQSGCAIGGRREGSRHCAKLESNYRRSTGEDPVWLLPEIEPEPLFELP
jgi:hypothetical protein